MNHCITFVVLVGLHFVVLNKFESLILKFESIELVIEHFSIEAKYCTPAPKVIDLIQLL